MIHIELASSSELTVAGNILLNRQLSHAIKVKNLFILRNTNNT